jgi:outer membrane protein assembly factor BamB
VVAVLVVAALTVLANPSNGVSFFNWPGYLFGAGHPSVNVASTTVTTSNVGSLTAVWHWVPPAGPVAGSNQKLFASPTVYDGRVYVGANNGVFYALDEQTGTVLWSRFTGYVQKHTCGARGMISTATLTGDPVTGALTAYVAGADGYLYALDAATGNVVWKSVVGIPSTTVNDYYNWASPVVFEGHVYMGVSSQCDQPFVPGGLVMYDQHSGTQLARFYSEPPGVNGGGVWTSPAVDDSGAYITTASPCPKKGVTNQDACAIVSLDKDTLAKRGSWFPLYAERPAGDADFGGSPVLFTATINGMSTPMVAGCNKNGILYGWSRGNVSVGPVWRFQVGIGTKSGQLACLTAPVWDGQHLFEAGNQTTINGVSYRGSIRELNPDDGTPIWQTGLPGIVLGSPTMNGNGILAVSTYDSSGVQNATYFVDKTNGKVLASIPTPQNSSTFAQPVFADRYVFLAPIVGGLTAYAPAG